MIRLSRSEARALGIRPPAADRPADGMNRTERRFAEVLAGARARGQLVAYWREPIKLRLAGRTSYTPDFGVWMHHHGAIGPTLALVEIKGFLRDDAAVKIKVAASLYPCFRFLLCYRGRAGWRTHEVTDRGIGVNPIEVPWIQGG